LNDELEGGELIEQEEAQIDLNALISLGAQLIENSHQQSQDKLALQKENLRVGEERLKIEKSAFIYKYWLLVLIVLAVLGIAAGLIFIKNDTVSGMSMLSHIGAVVAGIIAGSGWERVRAK